MDEMKKMAPFVVAELRPGTKTTKKPGSVKGEVAAAVKSGPFNPKQRAALNASVKWHQRTGTKMTKASVAKVAGVRF